MFRLLKLKTLFIFVTIIFLLQSCSSSVENSSSKKIEISSEECEWMTKFFKDLLFEEEGAFTLFGDKPIVVSLLYYYTEEEFRTFYEALPEAAKKNTQMTKYDFAENWSKWEKMKDRFPIYNYLFAKRCFSEDKKIYYGFFVNIVETALALQENYEDFRRVVGYDFHPFDEVFTIKDENSIFWKTVLKNHALQGILFGFGKKNSYLFQWMVEKYDQDSNKEFIQNYLLAQISDKSPQYGTASIDNFSLPVFRHYSSEENDQLLMKYHHQRKRIKLLYKKENFLEATLSKLTSKAGITKSS